MYFWVKEIPHYRGIDGKKLILSCICSNLTLKDKKVSIQLTEFFSLIETVTKQVPETSAMFEPAINGLNKRKIERLYARNPIVLAWRDSLRTINWEEMFPYPSVSLEHIRQLLALV